MDAVTVRFFASRAEDTIPVAVRAEIWGQTVFSILSPGRAMAGIRCHTVAKEKNGISREWKNLPSGA